MDEQELIQRCLSGDQAAWGELLEKYDPALRRLARATLQSLCRPARDPDVEDIRSGVLETLIAGRYRVLRSFRWECSFESWLRVIVRTVCVRSMRRKTVDPRDLPRPPSSELPLDQILSGEMRAAVRQALDELPPREKLVLSMFFIDGRSYQEISSAAQLPMGTIATIISRTRARLREMLRKRGLGEDA